MVNMHDCVHFEKGFDENPSCTLPLSHFFLRIFKSLSDSGMASADFFLEGCV